MSRQYLRRCSLKVFNILETLDLSNLRIRFQTRQADLQSWPSMWCRIYNVSPATANKIAAQLYTDVTLEAGYQSDDNFGIVFVGQIKRVLQGRESQTDTYVEIVANNMADAYAFATINDSIAGSSDGNEFVGKCLAALEPYGISRGTIADLSDQKFVRGVPIQGKVTDELRQLCYSAGATFAIRDNQLNILRYTAPADPPAEAIVLTRKTGLIGRPEQTPGGIQFKCLINPRIKPGRLVKIASETINRTTAVDGELLPSGQIQSATLRVKAFDWIPELADANGTYKVVVAEHVGDTRGQEWYTTCVGLVPGTATPIMTARGLTG